MAKRKQKKIYWGQLTSFFLCLLINQIRGNSMTVSLINATVLLVSLLFFAIKNPNKKINNFFIITLATIPIFHFKPQISLINLLWPIIFMLLLISLKVPSKKNVLYFLIATIISLGNLISEKIFNPPFDINNEKLIFFNQLARSIILDFRRQSRFLLFRLRPLFYNQTIYLYQLISNIGGFLSPKNLFDALLMANVYPLIKSLYCKIKQTKIKNNNFYGPILLVLISIGINKSPDKFNSLYLSAPIFLYFIQLGFNKINKKLYVLLLTLSLFNTYVI